MITFGLTGGIACGKSTVSKTFRANGIPMVDADVVARQVVEVGTPGLSQITEVFGKEYLNDDGTLNRTTLGHLVFSNSQAMNELNHIMGILIHKESAAQLKQLHDDGHSIVGFDAALICEKGNADKYRPLVVVDCPQHIQLERLMSRNNLTHEQAMARINAQFTSEYRVALADFVIDSSMSIKNSIQQTEIVIYELQQLSKFSLVSYARKNS
jgi:dephospho-CoA kinase